MAGEMLQSRLHLQVECCSLRPPHRWAAEAFFFALAGMHRRSNILLGRLGELGSGTSRDPRILTLPLSAAQACIPPCGKHFILSSQWRGKGNGRGQNLELEVGEHGWASEPKEARKGLDKIK